MAPDQGHLAQVPSLRLGVLAIPFALFGFVIGSVVMRCLRQGLEGCLEGGLPGASRRVLLAACFAACLVLRGATPAHAIDDIAKGETIALLSYNIHGLFRFAATDHPVERMPTIGWLSRPYDVMLYQEDFEYHRDLVRQLDGHVDFTGNGVGGSPWRILAKALAVPITMWIPHFSPPYGSGVSTAVRRRFDVVETSTHIYEACDGWLDSNFDCWASKGYLRVRLRLANGGEVDVYNTHLESGADKPSTLARRKQLGELAGDVERLSPTQAVIVGGDLNLSYLRSGDRKSLTQFRDRLGLVDSGAGPESPLWRERDFVLYRSGVATKLQVTKAGEAKEFAQEERALSDHAALRVDFLVTR